MADYSTWAQRWDGKLAKPGTVDIKHGVLPNVKMRELTWLDDNGKAQLEAFGRVRPPILGNPPSWVTDEGAWDRAKTAVQKRWSSYTDPWAVVAYVYNQMTGG